MDFISIAIIITIVILWLLVFSMWKNGRNRDSKEHSNTNYSKKKFHRFRNIVSKIQQHSFTSSNYKPTPILTNNEINFLTKLQSALPEVGGYIFPQVSFTAFMQPVQNPKSRLFMKFLAIIARKRCDFLIVDKEFNPLFIVECDDSSHRGREKLDKERDQIVASIGVQTIRLYNNMLSANDIRAVILENIQVFNKIKINFSDDINVKGTNNE